MRLFIAMHLDAALRAEAHRLQEAIAAFTDQGVRLLPDESLHLTLKFLGDVEDARVSAVEQILEQTASVTPSFPLELAGAGCFPERGDVHIVWLGLKPHPALIACAQGLEQSLCGLGFEAEKREFVPHVTVARVKNPPRGARLRETVARSVPGCASQMVHSFALMESKLAAGGARYIERKMFSLGR